jgi:hypothetical protein
VAEDEANRCRPSTTLSKFYDVHRDAPTELARDLRRSFATIVPSQIQRSPSASRGRGGRGQGGRTPSGNAQGHHAQQGGGASRPCLILESAPGSESQAHPSALHIHLWLDHVKTSPRGSASSKRAAVMGAKRASTPSMLRLTSRVNSTPPRAGKQPTPRISAIS